MIDKTHPAFARRLRLSTGGIFAALILTCAALLAVAAAVGPSATEPEAAVSVEGPVSDTSDLRIMPGARFAGREASSGKLSSDIIR